MGTIDVLKNELNWCNRKIREGRKDLFELKERLESLIKIFAEEEKRILPDKINIKGVNYYKEESL